MVHGEDSFDVASFISTPTDEGLPQSPPRLPLLPSNMNNTDVELVRGYLDPAIRRRRKEHPPSDWYYGPAVVNDDLPSKDPCELPGLARNERGMRYKYYHTDHRALAFFNSRTLPDIHTTSGSWENKTSEKGIRAGHNGFVGIKRTMKFHHNEFHPYRVNDALSGTKTNWFMNVYYSCNKTDSFIQDGLVLCHVFEADSPDYNDTRKCLGCHGNHWDQAFGAPNPVCDAGNHWDQAFGAPNPVCDAGNHWDQAFGAPSKASFNSTHPGSRPMHHHDTEHRSNPVSNSYIAEFGNIMLGDPDPTNSADAENSGATRGVPPAADHGQSKKRKKISDVWDYFTKIFARDINGKVMTYAACNHCCKILSCSSTGGTTHLARHACPCKFKPVAAGRNDKGSGRDGREGHV